MLERKQDKHHIQRSVYETVKTLPGSFAVQDVYILTRRFAPWLKKAQVRRSLASLADYYTLLERISRGIYKIRQKPLDMS